VDFTYDGSPDEPTAVGSYGVAGVINDPAVTGSASGTLVIGDSMANWRQHHFQTPVNAGPAADTEDPDGDGLVNSKEYILGTNPAQPEAAPLLTTTATGNGLTLTFIARQAEGPGYGGMSRRCTLERSTDLATPWSPVPGHLDIAGAGQSVQVTDSAGTGKYFYRLKAILE
jgi:hypothetical protein